jgi:ribosome-associated protein
LCEWGARQERRKGLEAEELGRAVVELAVGKFGEDVLLLDIRAMSTIADYFVICSGTSERQLQAIYEAVQMGLRELGARLLHTEGTSASGWILMDYGAVIVHVLSPPTRRYYNLEQLWKDAKTVVRIQ